ncbi:hypothetical protein [Lacrimispora sp.]|uniref:hypothetical protein n=1 Tax=Lacrimispora sp. TaxID=2719234 RepID=UPI0029E12067|nr:hypothetical protein [Lacrimispora sp.]
MVFKSKRYLSCVLIAAMLICAVPISVYAETGQLLSEEDRDAKSTAGWVGEFDPRNDFDFSTTSPGTNWYQNIDISQYNIISPTDLIDGTRDMFEYCPFYNTRDNSKGTIYKDLPVTPGYYMLSASGEIALQFSNDTGKLKIEVYDNTAGTGSPISSSSASAQYKTGDWDPVSVNNVYLTPRAKMIRLVLEAATEEIDEYHYIDFDGLSVSLAPTATPPIITNMNNDLVVFTKSGPPIPLDKDQDITVKVDSGFGRTYEGGLLTASITGNGIASEDVLEIAQTGGITLSGGSVLYNGTSIGTYSAGGSEMNLSVSLNADAGDISVAALIKAIVYRNTNTVNPNTTSRTVMVSVSDNNNASEPVFITVNVNYPPVRKSGVSASDTSDRTVNSPYLLDLNTIFEDTNNDPLTYKVKVNEGAVQSTGNSYSFTPTEIGTYTLVFHAYDGNDESTDTYTVTLNVKAPNTPPVRKSGVSDTKLETIAVNKACEINLDTIFEDADGDSLTYVVSVNGGEEKAVAGDYSYTPASEGAYTLEFRAYDGSAYSTDTYKVNITAVNTPPVRKSNVEESVNESLTVGMAYALDLTEIFEDENQDPLTYKVKVNDNAEEIINKDYTFTPAATGSYTLIFKANDGTDDSTDTYTVTLNVKQPNLAPVRKSGLEESMSFTASVNSQFYIGLENVFEDPDDDPLTFMVKIDDNPEVSADDNFNYTVTSAGSHTLVFKASDGRLESTETFTISITATKIPLRSVTQPDAVTGIPNGSAKTAAALGLPETVRLVTDSGPEDADVTWNVAACSYDPDQEPEQTFDVEGTVSLPDYISNPDGISLDVTVRVTVKSKLPADMTLVSIVPVTPITGIPNGSAKTVLSLNLPANVILVTDQGNISAGVTWDLESGTYDPDQKTAQTFAVEGTVNLPAKVLNPDGVSLSVTAEVTVDAESLTDKTLERIYSISPVKGITNGTAKTVTALGIPAKVLLGTDDGNVQADVNWDLDSSSYDPGLSEEQTFTVDGTVELPDNVINPAGISLDVTVEVTVLEEEEEQEYYTLRIKVTKRPDKVSYTLGEDLDTQGLEVTEYQKASPSNAVRKVALSEDQYDLEYNLTRTGTRHVKVIYYGTDRNGDEKEFKDEFTVRVKEPPRDDSSDDDDDDDDREIIEPGRKSAGGDEDHYYPGTWNKDDTGWRLSGKDGSRVANTWVYTDWLGSKDWYFFDEKGYMITGWFEYKGNVYYLNPVSDGKKGHMYMGWNMIEGKWYYFSEAEDGTKGSMLKNTETPDGHRVGPDGVRIS